MTGAGALALLAAALLPGCAAAGSNEEAAMSPDKQATLPPARDGNIAIREEFDAAKAKNTAAAWDLFIARHPHHALTAEAKRARAKLPR